MYLMTYFRTGAEALHLAVSDDGLRWRALNGNRPVWDHWLRDPFVLRGPEGRFHLLATAGWHQDSILHAVSEDLWTWREAENVPVMATVPGCRNCWAPEAFFDAGRGEYQLIWSSSVTEPNGPADWNHRIWGCRTRDFQVFTPPEVFFDPGYSVIDATVSRHDGQYLMAVKDERGDNTGAGVKAIRTATSPSANGPFSAISEPVTPPLTEGPILFRADGRWLLLYDHFMEGRFGVSSSADGLTWQDVTAEAAFPDGLRHAAVLELDDATAQTLRRKE